MLLPLTLLLASSVTPTKAQVSTYQFPVPRPTPGYVYEGWEAYNPTQPVTQVQRPDPVPQLDFGVTLDYSGSPVAGIPVPGSFLGISIEMSLAEAVIGPNATWIRPQFLNLMSTLKERGGNPVLRLGGNSQEKAYLVDEIDGGRHATERQLFGARTPTNTPTLLYTKGIFEAMREASDLLGIEWFIGLPMNQTTPARLDIAEVAQPILGDYLRSMHLGNEPDLYEKHEKRPAGYDEAAYMEEYQSIVNQLRANPNIARPNILGGPAFCECSTGWGNAHVINEMGYLDRFGDAINTLIVMHYPTDNCPEEDGSYPPIEEQYADIRYRFGNFAQHYGSMSPVRFASLYTEMVAISQRVNKPLVLLETNTASCNGFLGLSDSFLAALWNLDLGLQLASTGFTHAMIHLGGQQAYYNPFMAPPWNATAPFMWTVAPPMYAILVSSEVLGPTNQARVADIGLNNNNTNMAGYVVYENNQPVRMVLINYMSDTTGALDYTARVQVNGVSSVSVRYLVAEALNSKHGISYANQTWGGYFESDGVLRGEQVTETVPCAGGVCPIRVPAPGVAVVFLTSDLIFDARNGDAIQTYVTSHTTEMRNTAAVDGLTLATSNGMDAATREKMRGASTSDSKKNASYLGYNASVPWATLAFAGSILLTRYLSL
ncbi:hypothetical protein BKA62DRAFT_828089 [Auriculariales sp. MPI-PUGE-AT-0066]|nr:hypothetical protein BKA62DRAFT_828089 [Auriculariales sp. MPI-PUGE-AT-0066]